MKSGPHDRADGRIPGRIGSILRSVLASGTGESRRPVLGDHNESNVRGLYVIGDLAGAPVIKLAMEQGVDTIAHVASLPDARTGSPTRPGRDRLCHACFADNAEGASRCARCEGALPQREVPETYDVLIAGAGAAGLNAALECQARGLTVCVLEKERIANTIENFPEGKWIYAEPDSRPPKGKLWLDGATKEDLVERWKQIIRDANLEVHVQRGLARVEKKDGVFRIETEGEGRTTFQARRVLIAIGQRGNPRKLGVPGEDQERVYHRLYAPKHYRNEKILVVGGGNSAVEAALTLSQENEVTLSYRGEAFSRLFKDNERLLDEAVAQGRIQVFLESRVRSFGDRTATLSTREGERSLPIDHAFVLIGAELPVTFLKSIGLALENDWEGKPLLALAITGGLFFLYWLLTGGLGRIGWGGGSAHTTPGAALAAGAFDPVRAALTAAALFLGGVLAFRAFARSDRYAYLALSFQIVYFVYAVAKGLWPWVDWLPKEHGHVVLAGRSGSFWYTVLYTAVMTVFGLQAMKRWGFDKKDRFQILRYTSLILFQWIFFFLVPEVLFQWAARYEGVAKAIGNESWRSYGIVYAWPLFFYTFFNDPAVIWIVWGIVLAFVLIPLLVFWHGKRYCSWICGCGGLAETLGDRWRHLAPKGKTSIGLEWMNFAVLAAAVVVTIAVLVKDAIPFLREPALTGLRFYQVTVDIWLVAILPVTLYPFMGGKVWCRYWCPLAKMMQIFSKAYGKFRIEANEKCIACGECSRYCQVGIPVMQYALKQETLDNKTSSCIGCGICVTACPMDVLSFGGAEGGGGKDRLVTG